MTAEWCIAAVLSTSQTTRVGILSFRLVAPKRKSVCCSSGVGVFGDFTRQEHTEILGSSDKAAMGWNLKQILCISWRHVMLVSCCSEEWNMTIIKGKILPFSALALFARITRIHSQRLAPGLDAAWAAEAVKYRRVLINDSFYCNL